MIKVEHLSKSFLQPDGREVEVLHDLNFHVAEGEVVSIIGPSGAGKSVLLRCLNMLERPTGGVVVVGGERVTDEGYQLVNLRQKTGMVFQQFNLSPHISVLENVMLAPMKVKRMSRADAEELAMKHLRRVGMANHAHRMPLTLSGGQQQRAAIARTLAMQPSIILFDEPLSALDPTTVAEVQGVIQNLAAEGMTMMIVTHKMKFAHDIGSRVFFLADGRIVEDGTPSQIFDNPVHESTRTFVRQIRRLVFDIGNIDFDFYDMTSQIKQFCLRCSMAEKMNTVTHIVEELVVLSAKRKGTIHIEVQYSDMTGHASVVMQQEGTQVSPLDDENADELAVMIIRGMSSDIQTEQLPQGVRLTINL